MLPYVRGHFGKSEMALKDCVASRMRGFSLLEVLVAFVILALALGVIMRIFSQGMSRVSDSDRYARAVTLAESKLAQVGADIPLEEDELYGKADAALNWRVRLAAYEPDPVQAEKPDAPVKPLPPVRLLQVEVEVTWAGAEAAPHSVRLATLKLAPRKVP